MRHNLSYRCRLSSSNAEVTAENWGAPRKRSGLVSTASQTNFYSNRDVILPHRKPLMMHEYGSMFLMVACRVSADAQARSSVHNMLLAAGVSPVASTLLRYKRRWLHFLDAAHIEIFCIAFVQKLDRDPIDTTRICKAVNTVASLGNDHMSAVR